MGFICIFTMHGYIIIDINKEKKLRTWTDPYILSEPNDTSGLKA
jgi:hypothetical protein